MKYMPFEHAEAPSPPSRRASLRPGDHAPDAASGWPHRLFKIALGIFVGAIGFSIAGMLLLWLVPSSLQLFGPYLQPLVLAPTWIYMALLALLPVLMYGPLVGWKRVALFAALGCGIGGGSELIGTTIGVPFGEYFYTSWLGPKILGHVPYFIPPSWFAMSLLSLDLAQRVTGRGRSARWPRLLLASTFMVLWDVALDPAMNGAGAATSPFSMGIELFWMYPEGDFYYGMPLSNWAGWFAVTFLIVCAYEFVAGGLPAESRWAPTVYLLNGLFPVALCLMYGLVVPGLVGAAAIAVPPLLLWWRAPQPAAARSLASS